MGKDHTASGVSALQIKLNTGQAFVSGSLTLEHFHSLCASDSRLLLLDGSKYGASPKLQTRSPAR